MDLHSIRSGSIPGWPIRFSLIVSESETREVAGGFNRDNHQRYATLAQLGRAVLL